jgi:ABC-2 type transport system permease protein
VDFLDVTVTPGLTEDDARALLEENEANAVLLVPDVPMEQTAQALLLHNISDPIGSATTVAASASVVDQVTLELTGAPRSVELTEQRTEGGGNSYFEFLGPGIIGMSLMLFATINLAGSLSRYREEGVLRRIRATPLPAWAFFSAVVGAHLIMTLVQLIVLIAVAEVLGANVLRGGVWLLVVALIGTLIFLNIGVIVAGRVRSRGGVEGAANAVTLPMMFLSGSFFPTSALPDAIQPLVQALPLTHMLAAMRGLTLDGESITAQGPQLLVMAGWIAVTFVLARMSFSFSDA